MTVARGHSRGRRRSCSSRRRRARAPPPQPALATASPPGSSSRSSAPSSPSAAWTPRCGSRRSTARRSCRCTSRACRMHLPLDAALPVQCDGALPLLEAIEQRAARSGVPVDSRIERGRSYRHAMREMVAHETFDTTVVTAADSGSGAAAGRDQLAAGERPGRDHRDPARNADRPRAPRPRRRGRRRELKR